jgi:hypothetical protein
MKLDRLGTQKTINVLTLAVLIAYVIFATPWLMWLAILLLLGNAFESRITRNLAQSWIKFAEVLGAFNSKVLLTLSFYLILTPLALVYRLFNRSLVEHFRANTKRSYFENMNKTYTPADFEKSW